ncbi:MAG: HypC/HybG/HupF family hydrogenase formation chaperone [Methanosarcinales archaeon]|nr:HypC/HybG/HupF family hydrogenase formation chaperone [Methanosarcinales archaeon]MCK4652368.1 HypC/HybG/HupF family hydrogenase formation chaperone [Methanosarcinales archaeon]MCK4811200.1 HypC/HybG/HupF family hydrogenase formation chaperone [Methanosarcinales archaeon]
MCLAVPGEILSITNSTATVDLGGIKQDVGLDLVDGAMVGWRSCSILSIANGSRDATRGHWQQF